MPTPERKPAQDADLTGLLSRYASDDAARAALEKLRWPKGVVCPRRDCGAVRDAHRIVSIPGSKTRKGLWRCDSCKRQFTATVGTIFEDSHIPIGTWLTAIHLLCASTKGMSAHQLHRMLGITYKSAWFMCHRIRHAMAKPPLVNKLRGIVEAEETSVGGKPENSHASDRGPDKEFAGHEPVNHQADESARGAAHTNAAEKLPLDLRARIHRDVP